MRAPTHVTNDYYEHKSVPLSYNGQEQAHTLTVHARCPISRHLSTPPRPAACHAPCSRRSNINAKALSWNVQPPRFPVRAHGTSASHSQFFTSTCPPGTPVPPAARHMCAQSYRAIHYVTGNIGPAVGVLTFETDNTPYRCSAR